MSTDKTEWFVKCSKQVHGGVYDYSLVEYKTAKEKVTIICPTHGSFQQTPDKHKRGGGCKKCSYAKASERIRFTADMFISRSNKLHEGRYDYSYVDYRNARTKVDIVCRKHGIFQQRPYQHLKGAGCKRCAIDRTRKIEIPDSLIDGDKWDCPVHGVVALGTDYYSASKRLHSICPECNESANLEQRKQHFLKRAIECHGDKYDYSNVHYVTAQDKVEIRCKTHGSFLQTPNSHTNGNGCRKCATARDYSLQTAAMHHRYLESNREKMEEVPTSVYLLHLPKLGENVYKVGVSRKHQDRYHRLSLVYGDLVLVKQVNTNGYQAYKNESMLHRVLEPFRYTAEGKPEGHTELFELDEDLLGKVLNYLQLMENLVEY